MAACSLLSVAIPALAQGVAYTITTSTVEPVQMAWWWRMSTANS